jgi:hypothetical protein
MKTSLRLLLLAVFAVLFVGTASAHYNPQLGRWLSRDPMGEAGGFNLYAYCGNDPVNRHDPLGLATYDLRGGGGVLDSGESWPAADLASFIAPISAAPRWMTSTSFLDDAYQSLLPSQLEMARKISLFGPSGMNPFDKSGISGAGRIANIKGSMTAAGINPTSSEAMTFVRALSPHFERYDAYMDGIYAEQTRAANSATNWQIFNLSIVQPLMFVLPELRVGRFLGSGVDAGAAGVAALRLEGPLAAEGRAAIHIGGGRDCIAYTAEHLNVMLNDCYEPLIGLRALVNRRNIATSAEATKLIESITGSTAGAAVRWSEAGEGVYAVLTKSRGGHVMFAEKSFKFGDVIIDAQIRKSFMANPIGKAFGFEDLLGIPGMPSSIEDLILVPFTK